MPPKRYLYHEGSRAFRIWFNQPYGYRLGKVSLTVDKEYERLTKVNCNHPCYIGFEFYDDQNEPRDQYKSILSDSKGNIIAEFKSDALSQFFCTVPWRTNFKSTWPIMLHAKILNDQSMTLTVYLKMEKVYPNLVSIIIGFFPRVLKEAQPVVGLLRRLNFITGENVSCVSHHGHNVNGECQPFDRNMEETALTDDFERFFGRLLSSRPATKPYSLHTKSLTCNLRAYQRDAVRFMIDRELNPKIPFDMHAKFFSSKRINDECYLMLNLGVFVKSDPSHELRNPLSLCGGILADEMGLGKTVEVLALIMSLTPKRTPTLQLDGHDDEYKYDEMNDVREVLNGIISTVVATVDGERGMRELDARKTKVADIKPKLLSALPSVQCTMCQCTVLHRAVHWSDELSKKHDFQCTECIELMEEPISIGATLIVVPKSIAHQWYEEVKKHVKDDIPVEIYRGSSIDGYKHPYYLNQFAIVIVTYEVMMKEVQFRKKMLRDQQSARRQTSHSTLSDSGLGKIVTECERTSLYSVKWWRICLDESQMISSDVLNIMCSDLEARARWCITGTPLTNSIKDIHTLLYFLALHPLEWDPIFEHFFSHPYANGTDDQSIIDLLAPIFWRTTKSMLSAEEKNKVHHHVEYVNLWPVEERLYQEVVCRTQRQVNRCLSGWPASQLLSRISRENAAKLASAISQVRLFLLTTNDDGLKEQEEKDKREIQKRLWEIKRKGAYTPQNMYRRLLILKRNDIEPQLRYYIQLLCDYGAQLCKMKMNESALCMAYDTATRMLLSTKDLNMMMRFSAEVKWNGIAAVKRENHIEIDSVVKDCEKDKLQPILYDGKQIVNIYRNRQRILNCDSIDPSNTLDTPASDILCDLYHTVHDTLCKSAIETLNMDVNRWKQRSTVDYKNNELRKWVRDIEDIFVDKPSLLNTERLNNKMSMTDMRTWLNGECVEIANLADHLQNMINRSIEVALLDEATMDEARYQVLDLPITVDTVNTKEEESDDESETSSETDESETHVGGSPATKKIRLDENVTKSVADLTAEEKDVNLLGQSIDNLYEGVLMCNGKSRRRAESCIFCATREAAVRLAIMIPAGDWKSPRVSQPQALENDLCESLDRSKNGGRGVVVSESQCQHIFTSARHLSNLWTDIHSSCKYKINTVRQLRAFTQLSQQYRDTGCDDKTLLERISRDLQAQEKEYNISLSNLRYAISLKNEFESSQCGDDDQDSMNRECPVCLEPMKDEWYVFPCAHCTCKDCFLRLKRRAEPSDMLACVVCRHQFTAKTSILVNSIPHKKVKKPEMKGEPRDERLSSKFNAIVRRVRAILSSNPNEKILVFTTEQNGLYNLDHIFSMCNLPHSTLYASMTHTIVNEFNTNPSIRVLLMRYESGGKGLNLTIANHIIFADPIENCSLQRQAVGRCDRIGQTKPVHVYHIVVKNTVDERIYKVTRAQDGRTERENMNGNEEEKEGGLQGIDTEWTVGSFLALFNIDEGSDK